jgi:hypothetical protein
MNIIYCALNLKSGLRSLSNSGTCVAQDAYPSITGILKLQAWISNVYDGKARRKYLTVSVPGVIFEKSELLPGQRGSRWYSFGVLLRKQAIWILYRNKFRYPWITSTKREALWREDPPRKLATWRDSDLEQGLKIAVASAGLPVRSAEINYPNSLETNIRVNTLWNCWRRRDSVCSTIPVRSLNAELSSAKLIWYLANLISREWQLIQKELPNRNPLQSQYYSTRCISQPCTVDSRALNCWWWGVPLRQI